MLEASENKMMKKASTKAAEVEVVETSFFYPDHSITVTASSQEEADKKVLDIINKNNK